jgi:hypothetical protein
MENTVGIGEDEGDLGRRRKIENPAAAAASKHKRPSGLESKTRTALWSVDRTDRDVMRDLRNNSSCTYRSSGSRMPYKQDRDEEVSCACAHYVS